MHLDIKIIQVHACTRFQTLVAAIFFQNYPLATCLNPRFIKDANAKGGESNMKGVLCKRCECSCKNQMKMKKFKHAMVEFKYGITTGLPVGKGSKFRVF